MNDAANALEALRLISDWAKWLITIETGAIAIIGAIVSSKSAGWHLSVRTLASGAIACFVLSIIAAAALLLSLPDIAQNLRPGANVWLAGDSVLIGVFGIDTQTLAIVESLFFGFGIVFFASLILVVAWSSAASPRA